MPGSWPAGNSMSTTGPVIWMTRPRPAGASVVMSGSASCVLTSASVRAGRDLDHLASDVGLSDLVVRERQVLDELLGVLGCVLHRDHPGALLARLALEHRLVDAGRDVAGEERSQEVRGAGLEQELVAGDPFH